MNVKSGSRMDLLLCSWLLPCHRWLSYLAADYVTLQLTTLHCSWLLLCRWLRYLEANCYFAAAYVTLHLNVLHTLKLTVTFRWLCYLAADYVTLKLTVNLQLTVTLKLLLPYSWRLPCSWLNADSTWPGAGWPAWPRTPGSVYRLSTLCLHFQALTVQAPSKMCAIQKFVFT